MTNQRINKGTQLMFVVAVVFASCKSIPPATIDPKYQRPKSSAIPPSLNLDEITRRILANDTVVINVKIVMPSDRIRLEAENRKLEKTVQTWKYIAAGMFLLAGGSYLLGL
jgi:hypothetical protein